jgi:Zn-dependent protease with chaperone function
LIYNNLIYFLVVILILSTNSAPAQPQFPTAAILAAFIAKAGFFRWYLSRIFDNKKVYNASRYSAAERKGAILAIIIFSLDIYLLDCQYFFDLLPLAKKLPVITSFSCLALFVFYLSLLWDAAAHSYQSSFGQKENHRAFILTNIKTNLPIVLPWILLSLLADLLQLASVPIIRDLLNSAWGEETIFILFFICLAIIFPAITTKLWGCTPLPPGPARERIESFCRSQNVHYKEIMVWPLFEGQALTAGVMGFTRKFRYLLVTPALLAALSPEEIEAVMAHELGHVKKRHLQLYFILFLGFGTIAQLATYPMLYLLTDSDLFYQAVHFANKKPGNALALASTLSMLLLMIVYFRYIMGFFMRNFERQADLFALKTMGTSTYLINVFEKISWLSGNIRELTSWHHFGIGQRIRCLQKCDRTPALITRHDRKVHIALATFAIVFLLSVFALWKMPDTFLNGAPREKFAEAVIRQKISEEPQNYAWQQLLGDLQYSRKLYQDAIQAYSAAIQLNPAHPEILNNLAWLLLTAENQAIQDPQWALMLAKQAVIIQPSAHILDTLAFAYWRNGLREQAVLAEKRAIAQQPTNLEYYLHQLKKYTETAPPSPIQNSGERQ